MATMNGVISSMALLYRIVISYNVAVCAVYGDNIDYCVACGGNTMA